VHRVLPDEGPAYGGNLVTIHGAGFASGATVSFGGVAATDTVVIDTNTITTRIPQPTSLNAYSVRSVDVKVVHPGGSSATLAGGYGYRPEDARFRVLASIPADGATGVPRNLVSAAVLLSGPADTSSGPYGTSDDSRYCRWHEVASANVTNGLRGFGPEARWVVFSRTGGGNLPINNQGAYRLILPRALQSIGGLPLTNGYSPDYDRVTFTLSSTTTDTSSPTLSSIAPADQATGVSTTTDIVLVFSEPVDPLTLGSTTITLKQGSTPVPYSLGLSTSLRTVTISPHAQLASSTKFTITVTSGVADLCGNSFSQNSYSFTTDNGTDATAPTIDRVEIEALPDSVDGSGTYVDSSGTSGKAFDLLVLRGGWLVTVDFSDEGGSGIDASTFSAKASVQVGSVAANTELASYFSVTSTRATWRIPASGLATGNDATLTFSIKDSASSPNTSSAATVTVDVYDLGSTVSGNSMDPLDDRETWVLRIDLDAYTATYATQSYPSKQGATTTLSSNGIPDFDEALRLVGLNTPNMTAAAAATVNSKVAANVYLRGTNDIVRHLVADRIRELLRERFGIDADGSPRDGSVNIEFLLPGEKGSLSSLPTYSTANASSSSKSFSEISIGGTAGAETSAYQGGSALASAWYDARNGSRQANLNYGATNATTGVYLMTMLKHQVNSGMLESVSKKLVAIHGGTPVGEHASDDEVLSGSYDRSSWTNATDNARYDDIFDAIEVVSLYVSTTLAHEIAHSVGLVAPGAPGTGLFGGAHYANTFTEATKDYPNTSHHLDFLGNDIMGPFSYFTDDIATGFDFQRFSPLDIAYLRSRLGYDETR